MGERFSAKKVGTPHGNGAAEGRLANVKRYDAGAVSPGSESDEAVSSSPHLAQ